MKVNNLQCRTVYSCVAPHSTTPCSPKSKWATGTRLKLSIRQLLALPRECTRRDLADARTALTPYCTTTYAINGPNMIERQCAATATLEDLLFAQLKIAETLGELEVETQKIWIFICPDATSLWHTSITTIDVCVNCGASGFSSCGGYP